MGNRSSWKVPFVDLNLLNKVKNNKNNKIIKTHSRRSFIIPLFVNCVFSVYNGRKYLPVVVTDQMVGCKLGDFSPTRTYYGHKFDKK